jgi:dTDP-4-dehydrorhamnose 3,5-epimerase-like enzyme
MSYLLEIPAHLDDRGSLYVIEEMLDFDATRVYFITNAAGTTRGMHRHKITKQALFVPKGSCVVKVQEKDSREIKSYILDVPQKLLYLDPEDFHWMLDFSQDCVLMVLASHNYDKADYVSEPHFALTESK